MKVEILKPMCDLKVWEVVMLSTLLRCRGAPEQVLMAQQVSDPVPGAKDINALQ